MGALLSLPITLLNFLLPFTKPGTPLLQDVAHTAILCGTLYYAPQIAEWCNTQPVQGTAVDGDGQREGEQGPIEGTEGPEGHELNRRREDDVPLDERLVLQDDGEEVVGGPPPFAPTPPPPGQQRQQQAPPPRVEDDFPNPLINDNPLNNNLAPGPANERPRPTPANRTIGAKKAKSLARKDQRRAYHEFHRQEAELRRLQEQDGAQEREALLQAERERRAKIEEEIREREREERDKVKREREKEAEEENERRERVVNLVREDVQRRGAVDLVHVAWEEGKDKIWVERLLRASGLLSQLQRDGEHVMITGQGWLVKIDQQLMKQAYADAAVFGDEHKGKVTFKQFGGLLEKAVLARTEASGHTY